MGNSTIVQKNITIKTFFHSNGQLSSRQFLVNEELHRDPKDGPAYESWHDNGQLFCREFWADGKLHRDPKDGPAYESWHSNGQLSYREFLVDGKWHRDPKDGPAHKSWHYNGQLSCQQFWVDGELLSEQEAERLLKPETPSCHGRSVVIDGKTYRLIEDKG